MLNAVMVIGSAPRAFPASSGLVQRETIYTRGDAAVTRGHTCRLAPLWTCIRH